MVSNIVRFATAVVLLSFWGCTNIVPEGEERAFLEHKDAIERYMEWKSHSAVWQTDLGAIVLKFVPPSDAKVNDLLYKMVREEVFDTMRFHKAFVDPVPYGLQIGDPRTKLKDQHYVPLDSIENLGTESFLEPVSTTANELEIEPGSILLVGREGSGTVEAHFFFALSRDLFMTDAYVVVGKVVQGLPVLQNLRKGDQVLRTQWLEDTQIEQELGALEALPKQYRKAIVFADPRKK